VTAAVGFLAASIDSSDWIDEVMGFGSESGSVIAEHAEAMTEANATEAEKGHLPSFQVFV
jgi:hypothetical protein